ncbi:transglycosylase SLT domain-containing protein [Acidovorax sp. ACV01]|uniref:transglycosylase SLT domain-containing protein n=1 Tax=Acidovorax sp. ACV01 TaxID=2769311 RepID=UPI001CE1C915|nr:transglycosylase SLT domain-containing protein [Acidovorax sp. ACV01]
MHRAIKYLAIAAGLVVLCALVASVLPTGTAPAPRTAQQLYPLPPVAQAPAPAAVPASQQAPASAPELVPPAAEPAPVIEAASQWAAPTKASPSPVPSAALQHRALLVRTAHAIWGLDAPVAVFAAQVHQESAWRVGAISHVGAQGLAQFMPATTKWIAGQDPELAMQQPFNPAWAIRALVTYDRWLYDRAPTHYAPRDRMWVALRSYNGGLGHWQREAASTGLAQPSRAQVDAACGKARRAAVHCKENLGYPHRILVVIQPRYLQWGPGL